MAATPSPSPALSGNSSAAAGGVPAVSPFRVVQRTDTPPKTLRGLNKPKCKQCGNVARSRCPYESCKSCCSKAQNPCHIHVLKQNATFQDKAPTSSSPLFDNQSTEPSPSGNSHRVVSLRQLSSNFAQFNNVHLPLRSRKPLTRKDAISINEWRFSKLKEYKDRNIEVENEAFDRYMQNVSLLEEVFSVKSVMEDSIGDGSSISDPNAASTATTTTTEDDTEAMVSGLKLKLRSNPMRMNNFRKRIQHVVDEGLKKLQKRDGDEKVPSEQNELDKGPEKWWVERASALGDLIDKLNKARTEEDLKSCSELKTHLFKEDKLTLSESEDADIKKNLATEDDLQPRNESGYTFPKPISSTEIDQETLNIVDDHFSSLDQIVGL